MRTAVKLGGYTIGLVAMFGAAMAIGNSVGPLASTVAADAGPEAHSDGGHSAAGTAASEPGTDHLPGGLMVSQDGYTLTLAQRSVPSGNPVAVQFRILGPDGNPVTGYDTAHDKQLHLIVVRRDLSGFQHVHPILDAAGTWSVPLDLSAAGDYRLLADFTPTGHDRGLTLGADLAVPGPYDPRPLPAPALTAEVPGGYTVSLAGALMPGRSSELTLTVSRDGVPLTDLQPYLAAYGHLVALRAGDLAYLHVHPAGEPGDGVTSPGPGIRFYATAPTAGDYRLYLDFQHDAVVRTAEFTVRAGEDPGAATAAGTSSAPVPGGHQDDEPDDHGH